MYIYIYIYMHTGGSREVTCLCSGERVHECAQDRVLRAPHIQAVHLRFHGLQYTVGTHDGVHLLPNTADYGWAGLSGEGGTGGSANN